MIPHPEINVVKWMKALEKIYMTQPSVTSLLFVLKVVTGVLNRSLEIRQAITRPSLQKYLKQWDKDFDIAAAEIVASGWSMTRQVEGGADDQTRKIVVNALLYSGWHEQWHKLSGHEVEGPMWMVGRPVALVVAMLYNQIAAVGALHDELMSSFVADAKEDLVMTIIRDVAGEFDEAAPGEPPTFRDRVTKGAGEVMDEFKSFVDWAKKEFGKAVPYVAAGFGVIAALVIWRTVK